jgi:Methyltransferase small domain
VPEPPVVDAARAAALRRALEAADFMVERIEATLGVGELSTAATDVALHELRLSGDDAFATLARLFLLGLSVPAAEVEKALSPVGVDDLAALGLVESTRGVRATVRLVPHGDYYLASDLAGDSLADAPGDWVPGVQAPSVTLAKLAVRRHVAATLDVGTGCGIQALLAAKHSDRVVATDVNPRALRIAAFNAALNGIESVELRQGDFFEPVAGERFELIVANPPYVISPDSLHLYRDSGLAGDEVSRRVVTEAPTALAEGGFAHLLVSWAHNAGEDWSEPLLAWVADSGCDAWLLHYKSEDPVTHAANWLGPLARGRPAEYREGLARWVRYVRELGIEEIGYGAVVLRRRSGPNWVRTDEIPLDRLESAGEHTLRVFAAADLLAELSDDEALLDQTFVLVDQHRIEQELVVRGDGPIVQSQTLELTDGLRFRAGLDRYSAALVRRLGADRPLRESLDGAAADLGLNEYERDRYRTAALDVVKRLLELGFLVR